jgi:hypothetical protein
MYSSKKLEERIAYIFQKKKKISLIILYFFSFFFKKEKKKKKNLVLPWLADHPNHPQPFWWVADHPLGWLATHWFSILFYFSINIIRVSFFFLIILIRFQLKYLRCHKTKE